MRGRKQRQKRDRSKVFSVRRSPKKPDLDYEPNISFKDIVQAGDMPSDILSKYNWQRRYGRWECTTKVRMPRDKEFSDRTILMTDEEYNEMFKRAA